MVFRAQKVSKDFDERAPGQEPAESWLVNSSALTWGFAKYRKQFKLWCSQVWKETVRFLSPVPVHCTKIYPMAVWSWFPHALASLCRPPVPNPILVSQVTQSFSLFPMMPIRALPNEVSSLSMLKPSLLQLAYKLAYEPISEIHELRPSEVRRLWPSAISEYRELACLFITMKLICSPIFIPRQIFVKGVFQ